MQNKKKKMGRKKSRIISNFIEFSNSAIDWQDNFTL